MKLIIPCEDCDREGARLKGLGFRIDGCTPLAARPGMCELVYDFARRLQHPPAAGRRPAPQQQRPHRPPCPSAGAATRSARKAWTRQAAGWGWGCQPCGR